MSVFNKTYENLLEDGKCELDNFGVVCEYMKRLAESQWKYRVAYKYNWWDNRNCWLIEVEK